MATRFLHRGLDLDSANSTANPFAFDRNDVLSAKVVNAAGSAETRHVPAIGYEAKTSSFTVSKSDNGKVFKFDSTTSIVATLPATEAGLTFTFVVGQLTAATGHSVSPAAADQIIGNGFTAADDKDAICSAATDRVGDAITIVGDGVDGWYITSVTGTWAREA